MPVISRNRRSSSPVTDGKVFKWRSDMVFNHEGWGPFSYRPCETGVPIIFRLSAERKNDPTPIHETWIWSRIIVGGYWMRSCSIVQTSWREAAEIKSSEGVEQHSALGSQDRGSLQCSCLKDFKLCLRWKGTARLTNFDVYISNVCFMLCCAKRRSWRLLPTFNKLFWIISVVLHRYAKRNC